MNIFTQLKKMSHLTHSEQQIVQFILSHPEQFLTMDTKEICSTCYVSMSTLHRFYHKLDLSGLSELKIKISSSLQNYSVEKKSFDFDFPVKQNQTHYQILGYIKEDYEQTLQETFNLFDLDEIRRTVHAMKKAKTIDIYTSAGNVNFAQNFKFQMSEIGYLVQVPIEEYQQRLTAATSDETHLAFIISFGGRGLLTPHLYRILKKNKTSILMISSTEIDSFYQPDYHLYLCSFENHYHKISSFSTRLSLLYILDIIYTCFFELDYEKNLKKKLDYYSKMTLISNER